MGDSIDSSDMIHWLLEQTCDGIEQLQPLYFSQGVDFCRTQAASDNPNFLIDTHQHDILLGVLRHPERQTLAQLYGPSVQSKPPSTSRTWLPEVAAFIKELDTLRKDFQDTGSAVHGSALQEVEQERSLLSKSKLCVRYNGQLTTRPCCSLAFIGTSSTL
jgi:hypothetical protein